MAFNNPSSKLERAVCFSLILQGKGTTSDTYQADYSGTRSLPNRTVMASSFSPQRPNRQEGVVHFQIQHHFPAAVQPGETESIQRVQKNAYLGETYDSMTVGDGNSFQITADAITAAGRALAVDESGGSDPVLAQLAADNPDMLEFRCDWVKQSNPFLIRGRADGDSSVWVEILNFEAFVTNATT